MSHHCVFVQYTIHVYQSYNRLWCITVSVNAIHLDCINIMIHFICKHCSTLCDVYPSSFSQFDDLRVPTIEHFWSTHFLFCSLQAKCCTWVTILSQSKYFSCISMFAYFFRLPSKQFKHSIMWQIISYLKSNYLIENYIKRFVYSTFFFSYSQC